MLSKSQFAGLANYNEAVIWLDKADSLPGASPDVREGVKVRTDSRSFALLTDNCLFLSDDDGRLLSLHY